VPAADSVDGVADAPDQALRGEFNQLRKLRQRNPALKVLWSFGGWTGSAGFAAAARDPAGFAASCLALLDDPRWAGVFDGIDIDWEYPNACGVTCDTSGPGALARVVQALRAALGPGRLLTAAVTADASAGGRIERADYAAAAGRLDWVMAMTYDYFGTTDPAGPTAPHAALTGYPAMPRAGADAGCRPANSCWASASTAGAGPASPRTRPAARRPARRRAARAPATRTTGCSAPTARPPGRSAARRMPAAARSGGATTPRPP